MPRTSARRPGKRPAARPARKSRKRPPSTKPPAIPGSPASALTAPAGCAFAPRCRKRHDRCSEQPPLEGDPLHVDACWLPRGDRQALRHDTVAAAVAAGDPGQPSLAEPAGSVEA